MSGTRTLRFSGKWKQCIMTVAPCTQEKNTSNYIRQMALAANVIGFFEGAYIGLSLTISHWKPCTVSKSQYHSLTHKNFDSRIFHQIMQNKKKTFGSSTLSGICRITELKVKSYSQLCNPHLRSHSVAYIRFLRVAAVAAWRTAADDLSALATRGTLF